MHATILGCGIQGVATAYAMQRLGYNITIIDSNVETLQKASQKLRILNCEIFKKSHSTNDIEGDVVISCLPYNCNNTVYAQLKGDIAYCDLGGNKAISESINNKANRKTFTDLGLAPGFANIIAEHYIKVLGVRNVKICVGGLPANPNGSLKYGRTFSTEGLRNEYSGIETIIEEGNAKQVKALTGIEMLPYENLEAFYTTGGLGTSVERLLGKLDNYCYKTLRYCGHVDLIKFLLEECELPNTTFNKAIENACPLITEDIVMIKIFSEKINISYNIYSDKNWTAMQKGTAFPTAAVADLMARKIISREGAINYGDVPFEEFHKNLQLLDLPAINT